MEQSKKDCQTLKEESQGRERELKAQLTQVGLHRVCRSMYERRGVHLQ